MPIKRNIRLMYAIALLHGMVFYAPIASLYRQAAGLNLAQIALIESISYILCLAMELPWGFLADRMGYRKTMVACCGFYLLSKLVFWQADSFPAFLLERFCLSIALAGLSGVEESMLYLSCGAGDYQRIYGRFEACGTAGMLFSSLVYLLWIGSSYRTAALYTMIAYAGATLLSIGLQEVHPSAKDHRSHPARFPGLLKSMLKNRSLLILLLGFAVFQEAAQMVCVWLNQNQYLRCGMQTRGVALAHILVQTVMLCSARSARLTRLLGLRRFGSLAFAVSAAGCAALAFSRSAAVSMVCISAVAAARALMLPLASSLLNRQITTADRATQLSCFALIQNCAAAGVQTFWGRTADVSLDAAFLLCALACICAWIAFLRFCRKAQPDLSA